MYYVVIKLPFSTHRGNIQRTIQKLLANTHKKIRCFDGFRCQKYYETFDGFRRCALNRLLYNNHTESMMMDFGEEMIVLLD